MLSREEIIKEFTDKYKYYHLLALNVAGVQDADDLFQEVTLMLLEFSEERLQGYYNPVHGLKPIFIKMLCNQYKSNTSKFHKEYRKQNKFIATKGKDIVYNDEQTEIENTNYDFKVLKEISENLHKLNSEMFPNAIDELVFNLYIEQGSLRKVLIALPENLANDFDLKKVHELVKKVQATYKKYYQDLEVKSIKCEQAKIKNTAHLTALIIEGENTLYILQHSQRAEYYKNDIYKLERSLDVKRLALQELAPQQA